MNKTCPSPEPDQYVPPSGAAGQAVVDNNSRHGLPTSPSARRARSPRSSPHPHGGGSVKREFKGMPCTPSSRLLIDAASAAAATAASGNAQHPDAVAPRREPRSPPTQMAVLPEAPRRRGGQRAPRAPPPAMPLLPATSEWALTVSRPPGGAATGDKTRPPRCRPTASRSAAVGDRGGGRSGVSGSGVRDSGGWRPRR